MCRGVPASVRTQADDLAAAVESLAVERDRTEPGAPEGSPAADVGPVWSALRETRAYIGQEYRSRGSVGGGAGIRVCAGVVWSSVRATCPGGQRRVKKEHTVNLSCSFCGKSQREVRKLIAGPDGLHLRRVHQALQRHHRRGARPRGGQAAGLAAHPHRDQVVPRRLRHRPGPREEGPRGRGLQPLQAHLPEEASRPAPPRGEGRAGTRTSSSARATSCSSAPPAAARRCSPRAWRASSTSPSPSPTPPASPRPATWARTSRTSSRTCSTTPTTTWRRPPGASSTSTRSTRSPARATPRRSPATSAARACSRRS